VALDAIASAELNGGRTLREPGNKGMHGISGMKDIWHPDCLNLDARIAHGSPGSAGSPQVDVRSPSASLLSSARYFKFCNSLTIIL
jgi:hypothetical protein